MLTGGKITHPRQAITLGWAQVSKDISRAVVATALTLFFALLIGLAIHQFLPTFVPFLAGIEAGIFRVGLLYFFARSARGDSEFTDIFAGFRNFLSPAALSAAFITFLSFYWLGLMMGGVFAIALAAVVTFGVETVFGFSYVSIAAGDDSWWWGALDRSKRLTLPIWKDLAILNLSLMVLNAFGLIFAGVGVLVTLPISLCAQIEVYRALASQAASDSPPASPPAA